MIYNMAYGAYRIYDAAQTSYSFAKMQATRVYNSIHPVVQNQILNVGKLLSSAWNETKSPRGFFIIPTALFAFKYRKHLRSFVAKVYKEPVYLVLAFGVIVAAMSIFNYFFGKDSLDMEKENLRQLQELNKQTEPIVPDFEKISSTLRLLFEKFNPDDLEKIQKDLGKINQVLVNREKQVQDIDEEFQKLDFEAFHLALDGLVNSFNEMLNTHGEKLPDFLSVIQDLEKALKIEEENKDRINKAKEEFSQVTEEIVTVGNLIHQNRIQKKNLLQLLEKQEESSLNTKDL